MVGKVESQGVAGIERRLAAREVSASIMRLAQTRGLHVVLLASVRSGDGKSTLCETLLTHARDVSDRTVQVIRLPDLKRLTPDQFDKSALVVIDGPAMLGSEDSLALSTPWLSAIDAAIFVVLGRQTLRSDLLKSVERLGALGVESVAAVWNGRDCMQPEGGGLSGLRSPRTWFRRSYRNVAAST